MTLAAFEDLTEAYDALIDWPARLANEETLLRHLVADVGAKHVLDAACGTGRHAAMLHSWGLTVEAADISAGMIRRCQTTFGQPPGLSWVVRGYDQPAAPNSFDLAFCIGNSLALAPTPEIASNAIAAMLGAVRPGGAVLVHVLNLWRLPDGLCQWQKSKRAQLTAGQTLIVKGVHRSGQRGYVDLLVALLDSPAEAPTSATAPSNIPLRSECVPFWGFEPTQLETMARAAGATHVDLYGGYQKQPYQRDLSLDLIGIFNK